jgi:methylmalonyl-CoA mutase N-terminal domain/subunit
VEQSLAINEENYQKINDLLDTYGTDEFTEGNIDIIQRSEDKETRSRSLADLAKSTRDRFYNRQSAGDEQTSNRTGVNEYTLSDTQSEENGGLDTSAKPTEGEPIKRKKQDSNYWTSRLSTIN